MDFYSQGRSNYFKVKDLDAFKDFCAKYGLEVIEKDQYIGFLCHEGLPSGSYDTEIVDEETGFEGWETAEIDLLADIAAMLEDGSTLVYQEVGYEGMRYVSGWAEALDNTGKRTSVSLNDIYEQCVSDGLPQPATQCEY